MKIFFKPSFNRDYKKLPSEIRKEVYSICMDVLMCKPTYFDVLEKDKHGNTDMDPLNRPDVDLALTQWTQLVDLYRALGVTVHLINPVQGLPDMTFTANPVFTFTGKNSHKYAMLANFRPERRRAEKEYFDSFFKNILGYTTISIPPELYFEGAGDAIPFGDVIFVGYGFRTAKETLKHLAVIEIMTGKKIVPLELKKTYSWSCNSIPHGHSDDGF